MVQIDANVVRRVAQLARLDLPAASIDRLSAQLESIIGYVRQIGEADVAGVEPIAHPLPLSNVLREDVVEPSLPLEKVMQNAPDSDGPFFKVPKVLNGDADSGG